MWLAPVSAVVPDIGYPVNFWGLWMEHVEGISLENFLHKGVPRRLPPKVRVAGCRGDVARRTGPRTGAAPAGWTAVFVTG